MYIILICYCVSLKFILSIVCLSIHPSVMLAPQRDKWHLNNNDIEIYWNHFGRLAIVFQQYMYMHIISPKIIICRTEIII